MYQFYLVQYTMCDPNCDNRGKCLITYSKNIINKCTVIIKLLNEIYLKRSDSDLEKSIILFLLCGSSVITLLPTLLVGLCIYSDYLYPCVNLIKDLLELCIEYDKFMKKNQTLKQVFF